MARNFAARMTRGLWHDVGATFVRGCQGRNGGSGCRGRDGKYGAVIIVLCRILVQGNGRSWADELTAAYEGPKLEAAGTSTTHRGWWQCCYSNNRLHWPLGRVKLKVQYRLLGTGF